MSVLIYYWPISVVYLFHNILLKVLEMHDALLLLHVRVSLWRPECYVKAELADSPVECEPQPGLVCRDTHSRTNGFCCYIVLNLSVFYLGTKQYFKLYGNWMVVNAKTNFATWTIRFTYVLCYGIALTNVKLASNIKEKTFFPDLLQKYTFHFQKVVNLHNINFDAHLFFFHSIVQRKLR